MLTWFMIAYNFLSYLDTHYQGPGISVHVYLTFLERVTFGNLAVFLSSYQCHFLHFIHVRRDGTVVKTPARRYRVQVLLRSGDQ